MIFKYKVLNHDYTYAKHVFQSLFHGARTSLMYIKSDDAFHK